MTNENTQNAAAQTPVQNPAPVQMPGSGSPSTAKPANQPDQKTGSEQAQKSASDQSKK